MYESKMIECFKSGQYWKLYRYVFLFVLIIFCILKQINQFLIQPTQTFPRGKDQRHTVYLDLSYKPNPKWRLNLTWQFHSGWPYTQERFRNIENPDIRYNHPQNRIPLQPPVYSTLTIEAGRAGIRHCLAGKPVYSRKTFR